jgi:hypothetical protein
MERLGKSNMNPLSLASLSEDLPSVVPHDASRFNNPSGHANRDIDVRMTGSDFETDPMLFAEFKVNELTVYRIVKRLIRGQFIWVGLPIPSTWEFDWDWDWDEHDQTDLCI